MKIVKIVLAILVIAILVCTCAALAFVASDPVSLGCRRACAHVKGPAWKDCILLCEQVRE